MKLYTSCQTHNKPMKYICTEHICTGNRMSCYDCKASSHLKHNCIEVKQIDNIIRQLDCEEINSTLPIVEDSLNHLFLNFNKLHEQCSEINKLMQSFQYDLPRKVLKNFSYFFISSKDSIYNYMQELSDDQVLQQSQNLAQLYRYLLNKSEQIQSKQKLCKIFEAICSKMQKSISNWKKTMQNSTTVFYNDMIKYGDINNWLKIYYQTHPEQLALPKVVKKKKININNAKNKEKEQARKGNRFKYSDLGNMGLDSQLQDQIYQMFNQIFQTQPDNLDNVDNYVEQQMNTRIKSQSSIVGIQTSQKQITSVKNNDKTYRRCVLSCSKIDKPILKKIILQTIDKLKEDQKYVEVLREFILEGPNQFDLQCMKALSKNFPNLTKFNYIWDFQQNGLRLQKQQVFFQKIHSMQKKIQDLKMSQELLDAYCQFPQLENLSITQIQQFESKKMKIKNKNIKHFTLGQYVQQRQEQQIPDSIKKQTLSFNGLITLNIFNIKKIDGNFMEKVLEKNVNSLKNIWLSQCVQVQESFYKALGNSKVENIIFEQIKKINSTIYIPQSIHSLILQNCQIYNEIPLKGLSRAINIENFSIFQSSFYNADNMGDTFIQILSEMTPSHLRYLNVGQCKTVTDKSLKCLQKMTSLIQICFDNTQIRLINLLKAEDCLKKIKKLGIVGLQIDDPRPATQNPLKRQLIIEKLIQKSPKLQTLSLKFTDELSSIPKEAFKNLKHISLLATTNKKQYRKKNLKDLIQILKQMKKSVNIV